MTRQKNTISAEAAEARDDAAISPIASPKATTTATIKDVAQAAGVSVGTVSNVFNNRLALVRADKRERVLSAARDLNFQPSAAARTLARGHTRTLGVLFYRSSGAIVVDPYASIVLQGILNGAARAGYGVLLYPEHWRNKEQGAALFSDRSVDGVLVIAPRVETIPELSQLGLPLALVSVRYDEGSNTSVALAVDVDNEAGGRIATQHLLHLGHRKIAHLSGTQTQRSAHEREAGWRAALADAQVDPPAAYRIECDYQGATAYEATRQLLALPIPPTAIFAANDQIAFEGLQAARDTGVSVPDQLSVIGFDDVFAATLVTPRLTTIHQPLVQIGSAAVEGLIRHLQSDGTSVNNPPKPSPYCLFTPELVARGSTAAPPSEPLLPRPLHQPNHPILQGVLK